MGYELEFDKAFLSAIVDEAFEKSLGVRALRGIMEKYITPLIYELAGDQLPKGKICIDLTLIEESIDVFIKNWSSTMKKETSLGEVS